MSLLRLALFLGFSRQGHSFMGVFSSFLLGVRFDLRYVGILELLILLTGWLAGPAFFRRKAGRRWVLGLTGTAAFLLVFFYSVDFAHYSYLSQRLNASVLNYLADAEISTTMVWQTYPVFRILLLLVAGTWGMYRIVRWVYGRIARREGPVMARQDGQAGERTAGVAMGLGEGDRAAETAAKVVGGAREKRIRAGWYVGCFLLLGLAVFGRVGQYPLRWSDAFGLGSDYQANLALNPFQSFFSSLRYRHSAYDAARVREAVPVLAPFFGWDSVLPAKKAGLPAGIFDRRVSPRAGALSSKPNVVVVICESFSAYKSSMWGNPLNTTPFFGQMCQKGIFFDRCFTPSYGTARGVWAVITGIPDVAPATTTSSRNPQAVDQHTIISDFEGYDKYYFLGGSTSWANIRGLLTDNIPGLRLYEQQDYSAPKVDVWGISDKNLFLEANKVLKKERKPFFAVIQTADNHRPYTIPVEDRKAFQPLTLSREDLRRGGFESNEEMNAFRYTDFVYRTFIEAASMEGYFDNTIFLFVGDHGIPGDASTLFPRAWTDQRLTAEHVPLLIYAPKLLSPARIGGECSQLDVLPTLAGLCGLTYHNTTLGRDLLDPARLRGKELAFIYDPDQFYIGVVRGDYFYRRQLKTGKEEMVSVVGNDPPPAAVLQGPVKDELSRLSEAMYEASRYMLLKNKKGAGSGASAPGSGGH
ncbi:MAG TPA: sulfatase-like hydrolase/transferase [Puia sp.]|uniref:LTA synthase family protein n=1 Tax=Puia sp. TaxID=2045100 RepID=UPI002C426373|nr:sulfatase-like hydrolase/transferase [Puia sp.]HVU98528.1 sulfatase-like hydrolase/transferase [Puia sp.]